MTWQGLVSGRVGLSGFGYKINHVKEMTPSIYHN